MTRDDSVSLRDIYEAVQRVEDKMTKRIEKVECDIDTLQGFQNRTIGIASVISTFVGVVVSYIWSRIIGEK
jgi:hypothetical protein